MENVAEVFLGFLTELLFCLEVNWKESHGDRYWMNH